MKAIDSTTIATLISLKPLYPYSKVSIVLTTSSNNKKRLQDKNIAHINHNFAFVPLEYIFPHLLV